MDSTEARSTAAALMPELTTQLAQLVSIPSVAFPGFPAEPVERMAKTTLDMVRSAGFTTAELMPVASGYSPIYAEVEGPAGSPVVMLYAHYDVQPAPPEQGWTSDPWVATVKDDGRIYGRGAADDKSGIIAHIGTLAAFSGNPPCTVRLIIEGMEETDSNIEDFIDANPELFDCDVFVVCDSGNLRVGEPALTVALRGEVSCVVTVRTLEHPLHSGEFGGPAPDALLALSRLIASLTNDDGSIAVAGLASFDWVGPGLTEKAFAESADMLDGVAVIGTGEVSTRLWSSPSISAIGIDAPTIAGSSNALVPSASAKLSMRIAPGADPTVELDALVAHLKSHAPWGALVEVERGGESPPFSCPTDGPAYKAAAAALEAAYGKAVTETGSGGSIPLLDKLQEQSPRAEFILWGAEDLTAARIHSSDESVDPSEIEQMIISQVLLLKGVAARANRRR